MKLLDIVNSPWAIEPAKLDEIQGIYRTHMRGEKIDIGAVEAALGRPLANEPKPYEVIDGVAVIPVEGVIAKRANLFMQISGGTSSQLVQRDLRAAMDDPEVHSIVLSIDSPGGTVDGTQALADAVFAARQSKPVVALASGTMASAAYWVGSAAQAVYVADLTTYVGSIGVVAKHVDVSKAEEAQGVKTTEIVAGKYKRAASQYGPLTETGRATIQEQVDYTYSLFVAAVARQRGVSEETVLADMADGRVFIGQQAIDAGLVDGVSTLEQLVASLNADRAGVAQRRLAKDQPRLAAASDSQPTGVVSMTLEELKAQHPELVQALHAEGAAAECARIQSVQAQSMPGHEKLISSLMFDGKSTGGDAAQAVVAAERELRSKAAASLAGDAPEPVRPAAPPVVDAAAATAKLGQRPGFIDASVDQDALHAAAKRHQSTNPGVSFVDALKAVQKGA